MKSLRVKLPKTVKPPGKSKYRNHRVVDPVDGKFDSRREHRRWLVLKQMERQGEITTLMRQVPYELHCRGSSMVVCKYIADFVYFESGKRVVEDTKGMRTPTYRLKKKWLKEEYGISIRET